MEHIHDYIGIGFGPSNIALAIALEEGEWDGDILFLEKQAKSLWHPNMLLDGSDIQHNPIRDFITLRNPQSRFTFINYLHQKGRLIDYLNLGLDYPYRKEYSQYVSWAADQFGNVQYNCNITDVIHCPATTGREECYCLSSADGQTFFARGLVIGHGRSTFVPPIFETHLGEPVFHFTRYLESCEGLFDQVTETSVAVIGGSQSAIEIVLDLYGKYPNMQIHNIMRGYGYRLRETSPFTRTIFMPEFIDYFHALPTKEKRALRNELHHTNYSVADADAIRKLNGILYEDKLDSRGRISMETSSRVERLLEVDDRYVIELLERHTGEHTRVEVDAIIIATGFRDFGNAENEESLPGILCNLSGQFRFDESGAPKVNRDYSISYQKPEEGRHACYLNGLCEHSHGFGDAGTFSTLAFRAQAIETSIRDTVQEKKFLANV